MLSSLVDYSLCSPHFHEKAMKSKCILMAFALSINSAWAQVPQGSAKPPDWRLIHKSSGGVETHFEYNSVVRIGGSYRAWSITSFPEPTTFKGASFTVRSIQTYQEYDCKDRKFKILRLLAFDGPMASGTKLSEGAGTKGWQSQTDEPKSPNVVIFNDILKCPRS